MIEFFEAMQFWHWIILAIVLIAGEALGAAGFLLGAVMAALEVALISYIWPDLIMAATTILVCCFGLVMFCLVLVSL